MYDHAHARASGRRASRHFVHPIIFFSILARSMNFIRLMNVEVLPAAHKTPTVFTYAYKATRLLSTYSLSNLQTT